MDSATIMNYCVHVGFSLAVCILVALILYFCRNCIKVLLTVFIVIITIAVIIFIIIVPPCIILTADSLNYTFGIYVAHPAKKWSLMNLTINENCSFTDLKDFTLFS